MSMAPHEIAVEIFGQGWSKTITAQRGKGGRDEQDI